MELTPLVRSAEFDDVERELKALFISLYKKHIDDEVSEVALYGMPHIGPDSLVERSLVVDGLAVLRTTTMEQIRHLFHAWRYRNPQRGTKFLAAYLHTLFGPVFTIDQLWCKKAGTYPVDVMSEDEMLAAGESEADYFLTSRLRVDIETDMVPERILKAARTAVAARFVLELRAARRVALSYNVMFTGNSVVVCRTTGTAQYLQPPIEAPVSVATATLAGGSNFTYSEAGIGIEETSGAAVPQNSVLFNGEFVLSGGARVVMSEG